MLPQVSPRSDVWESTAEISYWWRLNTQIWIWCFWLAEENSPRRATNQKHFPGPVSDTSSEWNFCARFSDVISRGNQWWRRVMSAVFSDYTLTWISRIVGIWKKQAEKSGTTTQTLGFYMWLKMKILNHILHYLQPNTQHRRTVLLDSFYLNGPTLRFHPQTQ